MNPKWIFTPGFLILATTLLYASYTEFPSMLGGFLLVAGFGYIGMALMAWWS